MRNLALKAALLLGALAFTVLPAPAGAASASTTVLAQRNDNLRDFDWTVEKLRTNYAGWDTKVTDATRPQLEALVQDLRAQVATANDDQAFEILKRYVAFFHDGHVQLGRNSAPAPPAAAAGSRRATPTRALTEADVRQRLVALGDERDPVEGIWRIGGGRYTVGVLRTGPKPTHFAAVVLNTTAESWKAGDVKADITRGADASLMVKYRRGDHVVEDVKADLVAQDAALRLAGWGIWTRELPAVADPSLIARMFPSDEMFLSRLSNTTLWLRLPDFNDGRASVLKQLLTAHAAEIDATPNLIIDLRNNGGGSDFVYEPLIPLLYTRPIYTISIEMRASPDNLAQRQALANQLRAEAPEVAAELDNQNKTMAANIGRYFSPDTASFGIDRRAGVARSPKRVGVILDYAASSGEQFLLMARQSRKVTLFGQHNSAGILDFANVVGMTSPSGRFALAWPTSRSLRLPDDPVDPDGIAPDVRIPRDVSDPVLYVKSWLERQAD